MSDTPTTARPGRRKEIVILLLLVLLTAALISLAAGDAWERFFPREEQGSPTTGSLPAY